ncbi:dihydropteroate synthase [Nocardioides sp. NBC_00163]|uniref:dihydropteroate synthase n=1 Tax=Nocardioides sp. NBC_00163 TaxID=2975999 RepID=UPI00324BA317
MRSERVTQLVRRIHDDGPPLVCGIVNVTPDSFSDGGRFTTQAAAVRHGLLLVEEGADLIDVGGESTRPGARAIGEQEEIDRVVPVIADLVDRTACPVSVDTSSPAVMLAAAEAGASMVNDVRGLRRPGAMESVAASGVAVCISHMQGEPATMQDDPAYDDVVAEVSAYLVGQAEICERAGTPRHAIVLDPGFGFGKTLPHNLQLLASLADVAPSYPLMAGLSRKGMLGVLTGRAVGDRMVASVAAALVAAQRGARILRVHDVGPTRDAIAVWTAVRGTDG